MKGTTGRVPSMVRLYYVIAGLGIAVYGIRTGEWWSVAVGAGLLVLAAAGYLGRGDASSWARGEFDERRQAATDHAFRMAFFALAWWVGAVAVYADHHHVGAELIGAGNVVALATAFIGYAVVLRRS